MGDSHPATIPGPEDAALAAPPDDRNPAIADARRMFFAIMIGAAAFIGAVVLFIL